MRTLQIRWQRLVDEQGETCDRCGTTETAVEEAVQKLKQSLKELEIDVIFKKSTLNNSTFKKATLESNRIWIAEKSLEEWLSATNGQSQCNTSCGGLQCRTVVVGEKTYEAIPSQLIVKAGLLASAQLLDNEPHRGCSSSTCKPASSGCGK